MAVAIWMRASTCWGGVKVHELAGVVAQSEVQGLVPAPRASSLGGKLDAIGLIGSVPLVPVCRNVGFHPYLTEWAMRPMMIREN
jgi:hypothetical protein